MLELEAQVVDAIIEMVIGYFGNINEIQNMSL